MKFKIDINENNWNKKILDLLLYDHTTNNNIIWGTNDYKELGEDYHETFYITRDLITGNNSEVIQPRILKQKAEQKNRTKAKAEVFTPSWICNAQNNLVDHAWFGRNDVFNIEMEDKKWKSTIEKIIFPENKNKTWKKYVDERRMEITCGEAPYLVSRYDTVTGEIIPISERIGLLDRKLRVVTENTTTEDEWLKWAQRAIESIYGFEFQGDNLLLARENILLTYIEYMQYRLERTPTDKELIKIATIISWNIWQMDGLTYTIPFMKEQPRFEQSSLFEEQVAVAYCKIKDWRSKKVVTFKELLEQKKSKEKNN